MWWGEKEGGYLGNNGWIHHCGFYTLTLAEHALPARPSLSSLRVQSNFPTPGPLHVLLPWIEHSISRCPQRCSSPWLQGSLSQVPPLAMASHTPMYTRLLVSCKALTSTCNNCRCLTCLFILPAMT